MKMFHEDGLRRQMKSVVFFLSCAPSLSRIRLEIPLHAWKWVGVNWIYGSPLKLQMMSTRE